jgi:hypothetical protein
VFVDLAVDSTLDTVVVASVVCFQVSNFLFEESFLVDSLGVFGE